MAISDLFLGDPRTRAARYAGSRAEQGALRQTNAALQNRSVNPAAAAAARAMTSSDQRAANAGMIAQAQAADETARAQGAQELIGLGTNVLGSALSFAMPGAGGAVQSGLGGLQQGIQAGIGAATGAAGAPQQAPGGMGGLAALFPQGIAGGQQNAWDLYGQAPQAPSGPSPEAAGFLDQAGLGGAAPALGNLIVPTLPAPGPASAAEPMPGTGNTLGDQIARVPQLTQPGAAPGTVPQAQGDTGQQTRPYPSTMLSTGQPGSYVPDAAPAAEGAPLQPQAPGIPGMLPPSPLTGGQQLRGPSVAPQPMSIAEQILFRPTQALGIDPYTLRFLQAP